MTMRPCALLLLVCVASVHGMLLSAIPENAVVGIGDGKTYIGAILNSGGCVIERKGIVFALVVDHIEEIGPGGETVTTYVPSTVISDGQTDSPVVPTSLSVPVGDGSDLLVSGYQRQYYSGQAVITVETYHHHGSTTSYAYSMLEHQQFVEDEFGIIIRVDNWFRADPHLRTANSLRLSYRLESSEPMMVRHGKSVALSMEDDGVHIRYTPIALHATPLSRRLLLEPTPDMVSVWLSKTALRDVVTDEEGVRRAHKATVPRVGIAPSTTDLEFHPLDEAAAVPVVQFHVDIPFFSNSTMYRVTLGQPRSATLLMPAAAVILPVIISLLAATMTCWVSKNNM